MLEQAAATRWSLPPAECRGVGHSVVHAASGRRLGYGELIAAASALAVPAPATLRYKTASEFKYIGRDVPLTDRRAIVSGKFLQCRGIRRDELVDAGKMRRSLVKFDAQLIERAREAVSA